MIIKFLVCFSGYGMIKAKIIEEVHIFKSTRCTLLKIIFLFYSYILFIKLYMLRAINILFIINFQITQQNPPSNEI